MDSEVGVGVEGPGCVSQEWEVGRPGRSRCNARWRHETKAYDFAEEDDVLATDEEDAPVDLGEGLCWRVEEAFNREG